MPAENSRTLGVILAELKRQRIEGFGGLMDTTNLDKARIRHVIDLVALADAVDADHQARTAEEAPE